MVGESNERMHARTDTSTHTHIDEVKGTTYAYIHSRVHIYTFYTRTACTHKCILIIQAFICVHTYILYIFIHTVTQNEMHTHPNTQRHVFSVTPGIHTRNYLYQSISTKTTTHTL